MGVPRSSFYAAPETTQRDAAIVAEIRAITDEFVAYGYRRVGAELRHRGRVVNAKKVRRLMKEHDLNPRQSSALDPDDPTATMTDRSSPSSPKTWSRRGPTSSGWPT